MFVFPSVFILVLAVRRAHALTHYSLTRRLSTHSLTRARTHAFNGGPGGWVGGETGWRARDRACPPCRGAAVSPVRCGGRRLRTCQAPPQPAAAPANPGVRQAPRRRWGVGCHVRMPQVNEGGAGRGDVSIFCSSTFSCVRVGVFVLVRVPRVFFPLLVFHEFVWICVCLWSLGVSAVFFACVSAGHVCSMVEVLHFLSGGCFRDHGYTLVLVAYIILRISHTLCISVSACFFCMFATIHLFSRGSPSRPVDPLGLHVAPFAFVSQAQPICIFCGGTFDENVVQSTRNDNTHMQPLGERLSLLLHRVDAPLFVLWGWESRLASLRTAAVWYFRTPSKNDDTHLARVTAT